MGINTSESLHGKNVLLMFSGGRDSFLSACCLVECGVYVHMITYNNGCISGIDAVKTTAARIVEKYGPSCATFEGVHSIAGGLYRLQEEYLYQTAEETGKKYPYILPSQLSCLVCHTAMYVESIAYCTAHGFQLIAEGARKSQRFFVELPEMQKRYHNLAAQYGLDLITPVYDLQDDWERKLEMADRGFIPKTAEPQCWIGCPLRQDLSEDHVASLAAYYDDMILPKLPGYIDRRVQAMKIGATSPTSAVYDEI